MNTMLQLILIITAKTNICLRFPSYIMSGFVHAETYKYIVPEDLLKLRFTYECLSLRRTVFFVIFK